MKGQVKQTTLCYLEQDEKYLMLFRNKKKEDASAGKWIAVGGKFEENESPEDCMKREVLEETGYMVSKYRYAGVVTFISDTWPSEMMHLFVCSEFSGMEKQCSEGELHWVEKEKIADLPMWEGDRIFLRLLIEEAPFFSLKLRYVGESLVECILNGKPIDKADSHEVYKHFKGGLYRVLHEALDSETGEPCVVYQALYGERKIWVRPKSMFFETIERNGKKIPRFEKQN